MKTKKIFTQTRLILILYNLKMKYLLAIMATFILVFGNAQSLMLMTYNNRLDIEEDGENNWSNIKEFFTSVIQFYDPDIFGVQDAKHIQAIDIAPAILPNAYIKIGRNRINQRESSLIYYKKSRFKVLQNNTFWLSETIDVVSKDFDATFNRIHICFV